MPPRPRRNERGLVMPSGQRSIPRAPTPKRKRDQPDRPPDVEPLVTKAAGDLVALAAQIRACEVCRPSGSGEAAPFVLGSGFPRAPVFLVSDRPSAADLESGVAFTEAGEAIDKAFAALGMSLSWAYGTTAARTADGPPCPDHLLAELEAVEPRVIVAFGPRAVDGVRLMHGRCGLRVPDEVPQGVALMLRPGLVLIATEPLPEGVTKQDSKRRLWRDLQQVPGLVAEAAGA